MKIANKNIKQKYHSTSYYTMTLSEKWRQHKDTTFILRNCGSEFKERKAVSIPVQWDIGMLNEIVFGNEKVHDYYSYILIGSTDSFVNKAKTEEQSYADDPNAKYPF